MYASVDDAIESQKFTPNDIASRRMRVSTKLHLVKVSAKETDKCMKLRQMQNEQKRVVLRDMGGTQFTWECASQKRVTSAHFKHMPGEGSDEDDDDDDKPSPAETEAHEEAKQSASRLMMANQLRVVQCCTKKDHTAEPEFPLPTWATNIKGCVAAWDVHGDGPHIEVDTEVWWPLGELGNFKPDVAKMVNGDPHTAVEIQHSSSNKKRKREAYEAHDILGLQLSSRELNALCRDRKWDLDTNPVVAHHHPVTAQVNWVCDTCADAQEAQRLLDQAAEAEFQRQKAEQDQKDVLYMTTFDKREPSLWLKGFPCTLFPKDDEHRFEFLEEERDHEINPNPRRLFVRVNDPVQRDLVKQLKGEMACIRLASHPDPVEPERFNLYASWVVAGRALPIDQIKERDLAAVMDDLEPQEFAF